MSTTYNIVLTERSALPQDNNYTITNDKFNINGIVFAEIIDMPNSISGNLTMEQNLLATVETIYNNNHEQILSENKNKFIIVAVELKNDSSKEVIHASSYMNLMHDSIEYNKLPENGPMHHYEILNYHTDKFEVYIKREDAINKLNQYMNEFIVDYKSNIVKEFATKEQFLEYIK